MEDFVINAAYEHKKFEKMVHAKSRHILDFSEYNIEEISKKRDELKDVEKMDNMPRNTRLRPQK